MKRISAAAVAAITAISLSTGAAVAQDFGGSSASDRVITEDLIGFQIDNPESTTLGQEPTSSVEAANNSSESVKENSSEDTANDVIESSWGAGKSSIENDFENDDAPGTSLDTIIGVGAFVALAAGLYNLALQAGIQLPTL
ncbi:XRE family transcriptional regulator [Corynebacterium sp. L4756]|uniref:XRE family transcriptional regulator n=1 Tax=unclassified Corynebacterium TaxID=2624378 RepID=UPI00374CE8B8